MSIKGNVKARLLAMILALALVTAMACPALAETFSAIVTAGAMTVYKDAKLESAVTTLTEGEIVRVEAYSGRAARISWAGISGPEPGTAPGIPFCWASASPCPMWVSA